jgi:CheY-like chemotaxis protein
VVRSVVEAALGALRPLVNEKQIELNCQLDAADAVVQGDPDRLQQVFWNLMSNALKFTPTKGTITVRLQAEGNSVRLAVADTGEGIEPEFLPHVFDRFRQADSTSSRKHGGLGIGLTIVKHIISLHRGTVRADSPGKGQGATFTTTLPLSVVQQGVAKPATRPTHRGHLPSLKDICVLVVDDEPDAREVVGQILSRYHAAVTIAGSVNEAMEQFTARRPHVIVTDLAMPDQDGFALLRMIRQLPPDQGGAIPLIALTAYARSEDKARTSEAGFQSHLSKPIDPDELVDMVHHWARTPVQGATNDTVEKSQKHATIRASA